MYTYATETTHLHTPPAMQKRAQCTHERDLPVQTRPMMQRMHVRTMRAHEQQRMGACVQCGNAHVKRVSVRACTRMSVRLHGPGAGFLKISLKAFQVGNLAHRKGPCALHIGCAGAREAWSHRVGHWQPQVQWMRVMVAGRVLPRNPEKMRAMPPAATWESGCASWTSGRAGKTAAS